MKINLRSTSSIVKVNGVEARVWEGHTESGISVSCLITRIAVDKYEDCSEFEKELIEKPAPRAAMDAFLRDIAFEADE